MEYAESKGENRSDELFNIKFRYKDPKVSKNKLITKNINDTEMKFDAASTDFQFTTGVALYGMQLTDSEFIEDANIQLILKLAKDGRGEDEKGYRTEFTRLVESAVNY